MTTSGQSSLSLADQLTERFYAWERCGRGWQVHPFAVRPEPPFEPFWGHQLPEPSTQDTGRRPTFLSRLVDGLGSIFGGASNQDRALSITLPPRHAEPEEELAVDRIELAVQLPPDATPAIEMCEQFLVSLFGCQSPVSFEVIGTGRGITVQLAVDEADAVQVASQLGAYFPEAVIAEAEGGIRDALAQGGTDDLLVVEFGLSQEFMLPLASHNDLQSDPYVSLVAALARMRDGEVGVFQVLLEPVRHPWSQSVLRSVTFGDGSPFFEDDEDFLEQAKRKIAKPMYAAVVRIAVSAGEEQRTWELARLLTAALMQFQNPVGNELIPLSNDGYDDADHVNDVCNRQSRRSGMLLNCEELASLVHLPSDTVQNVKLDRVRGKSKAAPTSVVGHALVLGTNIHNGRSTSVTLSTEQRVRHMHVIGASGTGKSTFLLNLILQDIHNGNGVGVLDPHGDLIDQIIARIPESRIKEVVFVDPSDEEYAIGFNILSAHSDLEKNLLASDLVAVFRRFSTSWGDQMGSVLSNAVLAFLESSKGGTLSDLRRFLIEPPFRNEFLETVQDDHVRYYWKKEFPLLSGRPQAPLLTRLDTFLRPKPVRYMVSQPQNRLDIAHIMDSGKIFLAKLSQGLIGEENAALLGSLFVSKFHQLTLGRQAQSEKSRRLYTLYCDEFGSYVTPSMGKLLSGARKYRLGLNLSHQDLQQLHDADVESSLLSNAGTRVCFRVGDKDAKTLAEGFATFEPEDLRNLGTGQAICRVGRAEDDFNLATSNITEVAADVADAKRNAIVAHTRATYASERKVVEAALARDRGDVPAPAAPVAKLREPVDITPTSTPEGSSGTPPIVAQPIPPVVSTAPDNPGPPTVLVPKKSKSKRELPAEVAAMGKGGTKHKYIQHFIAQMGQGLGYKATIEMPTADGAGSVDVVLERGERRIACEISVTTPVEQELGNLKKCLSSGFSEVLMLATETKTLKALHKEATAAFEGKELAKVKFISASMPMQTVELLEVLGTSVEGNVAGYKVKVSRRGVSEKEMEERKRVISKVMRK